MNEDISTLETVIRDLADADCGDSEEVGAVIDRSCGLLEAMAERLRVYERADMEARLAGPLVMPDVFCSACGARQVAGRVI